MRRILVTGAGGSAAHNFVDSLNIAQEKFYVVGVDTRPYHIELTSLDKKYLIPRVDDPGYLQKLNKIIKKERIDFLHAQPDPEVSFISENREKIAARTFLPDKKTIKLCQSKTKLIDKLKKDGINTGESYFVESEKNLKAVLKEMFKNHKKVWIRAVKGAGSRASLPVSNFYQAKSWIEYWKDTRRLSYKDFMATEFLPGKEFAFQSLWQNGKLITCMARQRLEYFYGHLTPHGQSSTPSVALTVHRKDVNDSGTNAVLSADNNATGIFCVDLKENSKGVPCVTEINSGRFFTTSNFFARAGSNMPLYYIKMAFGEKLPRIKQYNPIPAGWYWVRMADMGFKLIKGEKWSSKKV